MIHVHRGRSDDGHAYLRVWGSCGACHVEGEPVIGMPSDEARLRALAVIGADLDASGRCTRCRAACAGVVL